MSVLEFLREKYKEKKTTLFFSSKFLAEEMNISLYQVKKQLSFLRKEKKVKWEMQYDDMTYCNCINESNSDCYCPYPEPFDRVHWLWLFNPKNK